MKYTIVKIGGVITQIAKETDTEGYTEGILEVFYPSDEELNNMTEKETEKWIDSNNKRMLAICNFLNETQF